MKIAFVNETWIDTEEQYGIKAGSRWANIRSKKQNLKCFPFPFNMAYTVALLKREGIEAVIKDGIAEEARKGEVMNWLLKEKPDVVLVETSTPSINADLEFTKEVKEKLGAKTILGGNHATALPSEMLKHKFVDFIVLGEYEYVVLELMQELAKKKQDFKKIKGLCFRNKEKIIINPRRELIQNLDDLPFPERDSLPIYKYNDASCKNFPNLCMIASRGCPFRCLYCLEPSVFYGKPNYRLRSPKNVVDEMVHLERKYKIKEIYFNDSSLTVDKDFVHRLCNEILSRRVKIPWSCMGDVRASFDTLKLMKQAGCIGINFGVESANPEILKNIRKPLNLETVQRFVKYCNKLGIYTHGTYMFGLPGETRATMKQTIDFAFNLGTTSAQFSIATPLPGTDFYEMAKKNGWLTTTDWSKYEGASTPVVAYPNLTERDMVEAMNYVKKRRIIQILKNPKVTLKYIIKIYKSEGLAGTVKELAQKTKFVLEK